MLGLSSSLLLQNCLWSVQVADHKNCANIQIVLPTVCVYFNILYYDVVEQYYCAMMFWFAICFIFCLRNLCSFL